MLPTSSKLRIRLIKNMNEKIKQQMNEKSPLFQQIKRYFVFEGNKLGIVRTDGTTSVDEIKKIEVSSVIEKEEAASLGIGGLVDDISTKLAEAQSTAIFDSLEKAISEVGNKVDGGGKSFSPELFLQAIDKLQIDFENGLPKLPTLTCSPDSMEHFQAVIKTTMNEDPFKTQFEEIINRKKKDFDEREASRKLVD